MKLFLTAIPFLFVLPVVAADPRPFAPTPFQLESPTATTPPIPATGVQTWAGGERVPLLGRLSLGDENNLRGFKFRDLGPKDENGEPIGGNTLARFTIEWTFPVMEKIREAVFYDVGFVNAGTYDFSGDNVNSDVGIGVRLDLPIGPVRIDYALPIQKDSFSSGSDRFQFNVDFPGPGYREQTARFLNK